MTKKPIFELMLLHQSKLAAIPIKKAAVKGKVRLVNILSLFAGPFAVAFISLCFLFKRSSLRMLTAGCYILLDVADMFNDSAILVELTEGTRKTIILTSPCPYSILANESFQAFTNFLGSLYLYFAAIHNNLLQSSNDASANASIGQRLFAYFKGLARAIYRYSASISYYHITRIYVKSNSDFIVSNCRFVLFHDEFTPYVSGFIDAACSLGIKSILYYSTLPVEDRSSLLKIYNVQSVYSDSWIKDFSNMLPQGTHYLSKDRKLLSFSPYRTNSFEVSFCFSSYYSLGMNELKRHIVKNIPAIIRDLCDNLPIQKFFLKTHPSDKRPKEYCKFLQAAFPSIEFEHVDTLLYDRINLSICGNSSIVDSFLFHSIPVIYNAKIDKYPYDYCNYVKNGLVIDGTYKIPTVDVINAFCSGA